MSDETSAESSGATELVPQPHGGAIKAGNPGNKGGGRTPGALRKLALRKGPKMLKVLEGIALSENAKDADKVAAAKEHLRIGMTQSIPVHEVRTKMDACFALLEERLAPAVAADMILEMKRIWDGR